jgi:uncharacterized protein (TIGR02453 family)
VTSVAASSFTGFRPEALQFLVDLAGNNERSWFQPRKAEYERLLKEPLEALCEALQERFVAQGLPMRADPKRSPFRIYRDVRFSKDKSPYKTNIGADFPYVEEEPAPGEPIHSRAGGYFHLAPEGSFVGGGMWHPEPARLAAFRAAVDTDPVGTMAALEDPGFVARFGTVNGDTLKRVPTGYAADHPHAELLKLKDVVFGRNLSDEEIFSPDLPDVLVVDFAAAMPVYRFLSTLPSADVAERR